ncbi:MAG: thiamine pyrophosphate-binding protein [Planctomycetota bacterium]
MAERIGRRAFLKVAAGQGIAVAASESAATDSRADIVPNASEAWISGKMSGAQALALAMIVEGTDCVFGIPGAQLNELWDAFKQKGVPYLLVTHEFSASAMADGAARASGKPGVLCVVPGPGLTNALTGIGEALLDSVPMVCVIGDVARGEHYHPFQVHEMDLLGLLKPVTKEVLQVTGLEDIPGLIRSAFQRSKEGEPGPVAVVVPYHLLTESGKFDCPPAAPCVLPFDEAAFQAALCLLRKPNLRVGIYAGMGAMDHSPELCQVAELLQAPVATSVSGKGVIPDSHPLAVGWGFGPQGTRTAEKTFKDVDLLLAIGVRFSEVSTGVYSNPEIKHSIQVDANANNLGRVIKPDVCVHADAGLFLSRLLETRDQIRRQPNPHLCSKIVKRKATDLNEHRHAYAQCGVDPMLFLLELRKALSCDALTFVDVTMTEHWAAEAFTVEQPRTYFNPTDNQSMGWSIPASLGAQRIFPGRQTVAIVGDGCFLMSAMEISTAAREGLPVKFFVLDDQAYHYMQVLQQAAYLRTTATALARLDYAALATGFGVGYDEIRSNEELENTLPAILGRQEPVLCRVHVNYANRPCRWIGAAKGQCIKMLSTKEKVRFLARLGYRSLEVHAPLSD